MDDDEAKTPLSKGNPYAHCDEIAERILLYKESVKDGLIGYDEKGPYVVWHEETDISGYTNNEQKDILLGFLRKEFEHGIYNNAIGIEIRMTNGSIKKVSQNATRGQRNIAVYSKQLVMIAELTRKTAYNGKRRTDVKEVIYFKARIKIRELMYCVQLNIFDSRISGYQLYDINKISQVGGPRSESEVHSGIDSILGEG